MSGWVLRCTDIVTGQSCNLIGSTDMCRLCFHSSDPQLYKINNAVMSHMHKHGFSRPTFSTTDNCVYYIVYVYHCTRYCTTPRPTTVLLQITKLILTLLFCCSVCSLYSLAHSLQLFQKGLHPRKQQTQQQQYSRAASPGVASVTTDTPSHQLGSSVFLTPQHH